VPVTVTRFVRHPHVLWRRSFDAVLLLPVAGDEVITLTGPDAAAWYLLVEPRTVDELAEHLGAVDVAAIENLVQRLAADRALLAGDAPPGAPG
jgi:hypothetical protein